MVVTRFISTGTHKGGLSAIPGYQPRIPANGKFIRVLSSRWLIPQYVGFFLGRVIVSSCGGLRR